MRHRSENSWLRKQHDQNDRGQAEDDSQLDNWREPTHAGCVDANRNRIRNIQSIEGHDSCENKTDHDVQDRTDKQRAQNADRHIPHRIFGFLCRR